MHTLPVEKQCEIYGASGCVRRAFVILKKEGCVPQKKGAFLNEKHLYRFVREAIASRPPSTIITVCRLTWDDDLWVDCGREMISIQDSFKPKAQTQYTNHINYGTPHANKTED